MIIRKGLVYKLKTSPELEQQLAGMLGCNRLVWNKALAMSRHRLENGYRIVRYQETAFWLTLWSQCDERSFLKDAPSQALQQTLKDLDRAWCDGFDKTQPLKRLPTFRKKNRDSGFRFPQGFKLDGNRVFLPKLGWIRFFKSREIEGAPKNITVTKKADGWYISVQVEQTIPDIRFHPSSTIVGLDRGVSQFAALSDGSFIEGRNSFKRWEGQLAKAQRQLSRKRKFSENWKKQQRRIAKIHHKIANVRKDRLHWVSTRMSQNHAIIVLEDLKVTNLSRSALDQPGRNVKAKSGLNKRILDQGWSMFQTMLTYKQLWQGGEVLLVKPHYTSQTCCVCGHRSQDNRHSQAVFVCEQCGHEDHADLNAAKNIVAAGHAVLACGETGLPVSVKQKPVGSREANPLLV